MVLSVISQDALGLVLIARDMGSAILRHTTANVFLDGWVAVVMRPIVLALRTAMAEGRAMIRLTLHFAWTVRQTGWEPLVRSPVFTGLRTPRTVENASVNHAIWEKAATASVTVRGHVTGHTASVART